VSDFDWESFDGSGIIKQSWEDLPRILREEFCGMIPKSKAVEYLKSLGVTQATAYRWLERAIEENILKFKDEHIFL
jgi:hypothetical protein